MIPRRKRRPPRSVRRKRRARDGEQQHLFHQALVGVASQPKEARSTKNYFFVWGMASSVWRLEGKGSHPLGTAFPAATPGLWKWRGYPRVRAVSVLPPPPCAVVLNSRACLLWGTEWDGT